jgi:hypothetical protein
MNLKEFRDSGLLWFVNRTLHLFGVVLVCTLNEDGSVTDLHPIKTSARGFTESNEHAGFRKLTKFLHANTDVLLKDLEE